MTRYIDAEKIEWHEQLEPLGNGKYEYCRVAYMDDIDDILSADVRENVHGEWVKSEKTDADWECSNCHDWFMWGDNIHLNFCPNCGADMRGE